MIDFCSLKEIQKALSDLEDNFKSEYNICLNEASVLCSLSDCCLTSSEIAKCVDLGASHASKTIRAVEDKGFIVRRIGTIDKRMMRFSLTTSGLELLKQIRQGNVMVPEILQKMITK